jgi:hypothetical protein
MAVSFTLLPFLPERPLFSLLLSPSSQFLAILPGDLVGSLPSSRLLVIGCSRAGCCLMVIVGCSCLIVMMGCSCLGCCCLIVYVFRSSFFLSSFLPS